MTDTQPPGRSRRRALALLGSAALTAIGITQCERRDEAPDAVAAALRDGEHNAGFARVRGPRPMQFPRDHAAHPAFRHEWWYLTGHLRDAADREYGFQLTFFRYALLPKALATPSRWRARDLMLAHFAVTDVSAQRFHHATRRARAALDLAGASNLAPRIWIGDWDLEWSGATDEHWLLHARTARVGLTLTARPTKPVVLQGDRGYSQKSAEPGNASLYYSMPRLTVDGELDIDGRHREVNGHAWLDREWGTSALGRAQVGWDWFALQLDDGRELTFYRLRRRDGSPDPYSRGLLVARDGSARALHAADIVMTPRRWWQSARTGRRYPVDWRVEGAGFDLALAARVDAQEWPGDLRYWEGQVAVSDARGTRGLGYLEMTGY